MTYFRPLYGDTALPHPQILTENQLALFQDRYRNITDQELLTMVCPTEAIQ